MYIFKRQFHADAYFVALILMAASLPLSKFAMSVMQFTLLGLWLWAGFCFEKVYFLFKHYNPLNALWEFVKYICKLSYDNVTGKLGMVLKNKVALVLISLFLIHILGLIHTVDFGYGFKDLRTKLPLLAFPVILSTMEPLSRKRFNILMIFYIIAVFAGTVASTIVLIKGEFTDIRDISIFISPIRFSLNICFAVFILLYYIFTKDIFGPGVRILFSVMVVWFTYFLLILESGIGIIILTTLSISLLIYQIIRQKNIYLRLGFITAIIVAPLLIYSYISKIVREYKSVPVVDFNTLDKVTPLGNPYSHDTIFMGIEDGRYIGLYIAWDELRDSWNKRSRFDFDGKDQSNQDIKYTVVRFLTSMDYRKDAEGVKKLTDEEVKIIERGIANINYVRNPSLSTRISKIMMGYHNYKHDHDPNGSSVLQRLEYWKASIVIIGENLMFGVGTGDLNIAFDNYYDKIKSSLDERNRWRSHNQYLSIFVGLGLFGFIWFLFTLFYPGIKSGKITEYFYFVFLFIMAVSMLSEDTIESQEGVTLFAYFNSLLLFSRSSGKG